jgi:hypothetical protein
MSGGRVASSTAAVLTGARCMPALEGSNEHIAQHEADHRSAQASGS